jgi:hypothetical protein
MNRSDEEHQIEVWEAVYERLRELLLQFGSEDVDRRADCWIHDQNVGTLQHKIYIRNLALLRPHIVSALQQLLTEFPGWEIMVAVSVPGPGDAWPDMGLTIRLHEIVDGLERKYFPVDYRDIVYNGSRRGSEYD